MILKRLLLALAMALTVGSTVMPQMADAASRADSCLYPTNLNGRPDCVGYFTNVPYPFDNSWDFVISGGMQVATTTSGFAYDPTAEADFFARMRGALNGSLLRDNVGAAFLIAVMMGKDGQNFNCPPSTPNTCRNNGISWARTNYAAWAKLVHYYNSKNLVDWNYGWAPTCSTSGTNPPSYENSAISTTLMDVTYHSKIDCSRIIPQIHFYDPTTGTDMMIQRICGNMLGNANRLNIPAYNLVPDVIPGTLGGTPLTWGGTVQSYDGTANTDYYLTATAHNPGVFPAYASDQFQLQVDNMSPGYAVRQLDSPTSPDTLDTGPPGYATSCSIAVADCWYWTYGNGLPWNRTSRQINAMHFRVAAGTPEGTQLCFAAWINDANFADGPAFVGPAGHCFVVHNPRYVSVQGHNSDIHAGGGVCDNVTAPASAGVITGNAKATGASGTYGDYVVSASAAAGINGLGSNGTTTAPGANALKVGGSGSYAQVCRPDLVKAAQAYQASGGGWQSISGAVNVGALNPAYDVYFATGPVSLSGTVNRKITIVSLSSDVTISGNIALSGASYSRQNVPSLGIIAAGNVFVLPGVTTVDAYIFANGNINTCNGLAISCNNTLLVHGFLMANSLTLRRLGPGGTNGVQIGENVQLSPQIYLNPPKLMDASVDDILLEGQGEKQPLF